MSSATELRVLLVRPAYRTRLTQAVRLVTEPLDLEYLAAIVTARGWHWRIHDGMVDSEPFSAVLAGFAPDIVALTGYYPALAEMLHLAAAVKAWRASTLVVTGGVHAELCPADFAVEAVDVVVQAGGAHTFGRLLDGFRAARSVTPVPGTWQRVSGTWRYEPLDPAATLPPLPHPDRSHLYRHRAAFTYLHCGPVALVRTAAGCPHGCSFCCCRLLNGGRYAPRDLAEVADEIAALDAPLIWLIDDTLLADPGRAAALADALAQRQGQRRFIIYARAADIAGNPGVCADLRRLGVSDVIVGMEAVEQAQLDGYAKGCSADDNRRCAELLAAAGIACTGLFIADPSFSRADFRRLDATIASLPLAAATVSIYTPFPGTAGWETAQARLTTRDCRYWDLCHLVLDPQRMSRSEFYLRFAWSNIRPLLHRPALRRHVLGQLRRGGWRL